MIYQAYKIVIVNIKKRSLVFVFQLLYLIHQDDFK